MQIKEEDLERPFRQVIISNIIDLFGKEALGLINNYNLDLIVLEIQKDE